MYDKESLEVTSDLLALNFSHYFVWVYRRRILSSLSLNDHDIWRTELQWINSILLEETKNYQIWYFDVEFLLT